MPQDVKQEKGGRGCRKMCFKISFAMVSATRPMPTMSSKTPRFSARRTNPIQPYAAGHMEIANATTWMKLGSSGNVELENGTDIFDP
jgi:hypothetical protein